VPIAHLLLFVLLNAVLRRDKACILPMKNEDGVMVARVWRRDPRVAAGTGKEAFLSQNALRGEGRVACLYFLRGAGSRSMCRADGSGLSMPDK